MKKTNSSKVTFVLAAAMSLMLFCLPQTELAAQCPVANFNTSIDPGVSECNNRGTTDPLDDVICFTRLDILSFDNLPIGSAQVTINGTSVGFWNPGGGFGLFFNAPLCLPLADAPFETVILFNDGCEYISSTASPFANPDCSTCDDTDGDGICDENDLCPGFDQDLSCNDAFCLDYFFQIGPTDFTCDNSGTTDPSDDVYCFNNLTFFGQTPQTPQANITMGGVNVGTYTLDTFITLDDTYCIPTNVDPYDITLSFDNGCSFTQTNPNPNGFPTCSDCSDVDSDGICDEADQCPSTPSGAEVDESGCALDPCGNNWTIEFQANNIICDDQDTADPSDDVMCFTRLLVTSGDGSQLTPNAGIFVNGVQTGPNTIAGDPAIVLYSQLECVSAVLPDFEVIFSLTPTCDFITTVPNPFDGAANGGAGCSCSDMDGDGVCDDDDQCPGNDDNADADGDGVPDACDACPALANLVPGDACPSDGDDCTDDGVVDAGCTCISTLIDTDGDGVCDLDDVCPGSDDNVDSDGDGTPDGCDACPALANLVPGDACPSDGDDCTDDGVVDAGCTCTSTLIDTDGDGVCDANDVCEGFDDNADADGDGIPDGCDTTDECDVCDSSANNTCYEYIKKVSFGCDWNYSGNNYGYGDFTGNVWDIHCGYWYGLTLKPGFNGCAYWENWNVWIDWNQDCDFDDADEHIGQACHWGNVYGNVSVPDHALSGNTTMRISMSYDGYQDACSNFEYGEVEDYTLNVICNNGNGNAPLAGMTAEYAELFAQAQTEFQQNEQADAMLRPGYVGGDRDRREIVLIAKDIESDPEVMVYPNPASSVVNISLNTALENGTVSVYDNIGRLVSQMATEGESPVLTLDVSDFAAGLYTVNIESNNVRTLTKQFVVTK